MAYGIVIRNSAGQVVLDNNERVARLRARISTGTGGGAVAYDLEGGTLAYVPIIQYSLWQDSPQVTVSGNVISWTASTYSIDLLIFIY